MILRIKTDDFSIFAGYKYTDETFTRNNEELNKYLQLYKANSEIKYLQVECDIDTLIHLLAYIVNSVNCKHFIRTKYSDDGKVQSYWLCFYKESNFVRKAL